MQIVELKVNVEKSQLTALEAQVKALQNKTIKINVDTSGFDMKAVNALTNYNKSLAQNQAAKAKVIQANAKLVHSNNEVALAHHKTMQAQMAATREMSKTTQQIEKSKQAYSKTAQEQVKYQREVEKSNRQQQRSNRVMGETSRGVSKASKEVSGFQKLMGGSVRQIAARMAMWQVMGAAVAAPIRAMKEAVDTMKNVDDELVEVRKVTQFNQQQMKGLEEQSYKTASAYGVAADEYLASVAAFARAGYKEQSADLAELSVKTQIVGDTTADVANQFLISTDAAYKYNGSVEKLGKVLDGANQIDNKYATSIEKIAEGMGLVAPVAAQAGIGVDELMASVGTITAVTQRSGAEAARAYRALILNILGDTKTEVEDGATWTAGEIEGLRDVLRQYAPEAVKAAEATGDIINPMEAISGLAQSMKDGVLTEQKLMEMVSDIGGKLRTSQLLALIQNWDMYESMLKDFQTAAGSADREVENAMDSWSRKVEVLKNTWTEFVSHMVSTDAIKGGLDGITRFVEFLDSGSGQASIKLAALSASIVGIGKALGALKGSRAFELLIKFFSATKEGGLLAALSKAATFIGPLGIALAAIAAVVATPAIVDLFTTDYSEQADSVKKLKDEYEELYGTLGEYEQLNAKAESGEGMTPYEKNRLQYLKQYRDELDQTIEKEKELARQKYQDEYGSMAQDSTDEDYYRNGGRGKKDRETIDVKNLREATQAFDDLNESAKNGRVSQEEYREELQDILSTYEDFYNTTKEGLDAGILDVDDLTDAQRALMDLYETMQKYMGLPVEEVGIAKAADDFDKIAEVAGRSVVNVEAFREAMLEAGASAEQIDGALSEMEERGAITIDVESDGAEDILADMEAIGVAVDGVNGTTIDIQGLQKLSSDLGLSSEQANLLIQKLAEVTGQSPVDVLLSATDSASSVIQDVTGLIDTYGDKNPNPTVKANDQASSTLSKIIGLIGSIKDKTVTITTTHVNSYTGTDTKDYHGHATGALNFQGGPTLLGDELSGDGSPRPELVITPGGRAFIAGMSGPVMTNLPGGSRIFKYSDTMDVLSGKDIYGLNAYASGSSSSVGGLFGNRRSLSDYLLHPSGGGASSSSGGSSASSGSSGGSSGGSSSRSGSSSGSSGTRSGSSSSGSGSRSGGGSSRSGGSSKSSSNKDEYLEGLKNQLSVLRAQYDFLEASDAETADLIAKSQEIQGQLHVINDYLRETGGDEEDIWKNAADWHKELDEIHKVTKEIYETERDLFETEVELYEHQGKSVTVQVAKLRQIQDNLHREADYLRSIQASQADINRLSIKWWEIQEKILSIQQDLMDELDNAISREITQARRRRDEQISILDERIEALRKEKEVQEEQLDIEEKRKRVEEARFALENAQNERNVRYYNATTGRWEWGADARNVKSAEEALAEASKDLADYERDELYDKQIEALEEQKKTLNDGFDELESRWERLQESLEEPLRDIKEILWDLLATGKLTDEQVALIKSLVGDIDGYAAAITEAVTAMRTAAKAVSSTGQEYNITSQKGLDFINNAGAGSIMTGGDGSTWTKNADGSVTITKGGNVYTTGAGSDTYTIGSEKGLDFLNTAPVGTHMTGGDDSIWVKNADGSTTITKNGSTYTIAGTAVSSGGSGSSGGGSSLKKTGGSKVDSGASASNAHFDYSSVNSGAKYQRVQAYDTGGVLSGMGGIKSTNANEIVVPPDVADFMLRPDAGNTFQQRMSELGYLYGATNRLPGAISSTLSNRSSNDHYGDVYTFGNIVMTEGQARSTTLYDLAQRSRTLGIYRNT